MSLAGKDTCQWTQAPLAAVLFSAIRTGTPVSVPRQPNSVMLPFVARADSPTGQQGVAPAGQQPTKTPTPTFTPTNTPTFTPTALPTDANNIQIDYQYDRLNRLTEAKYSTYGGGPLAPVVLGPAGRSTPTPTPIPLGVAKTITYTYDAVGNRLTQNNNGTVTNYNYDNANRLTNVNGVAYTWDNNGNLLSDGARSFQYDAANRLTVASQQSTVYSYTYNGAGDRLSQAVGGTTTRYALDPAAGLTQVLADGTNTYLYGMGRLAQQGGNTQYLGADALGSSLS